MNISIIGDGGWGTTLAILLYKKGYNIILWGAFPGYVKVVDKKRVNSKFLPGVKIPRGISITSCLDKALSGADLVVLAVPSQYMRSVAERIHKTGKTLDVPFLTVAKGIETKTLMCMSEVVKDVLGKIDLAVLSGPTISYEVVRGLPTTVVAASQNPSLVKRLQKIFTTSTFRVYTSDDVIGVELGGSLKNVIAIAAGALDGLGLKANTKAGLLTRGLAEISRLGEAIGANRQTFYGISGLGDLVTTCISEHGRNRWFGEQLGKGKSPREILKKTEMVVEGVVTAKSAYELAKKYNVEVPITEQVYQVLYKGKSPKRAITDLMSRPLKAEN